MYFAQVALVSETNRVSSSWLHRVSAALQKQALRDFGPIWRVWASVDAFDQLEDVPLGYLPIVILDNIHMPGAAGVHEDQNGQPFALVQYSDSWSLTASHECLEMLGDPYGNRLVGARSLDPNQGRVEYLLEVADPPEDARFSYTVDGIMMSDFTTRAFWGPVATESLRYSFTGACRGPYDVLPGGYISWHDPESDHWFQQFADDDGNKEIVDLGSATGRRESIRAWIDSRRQHTQLVNGVSGDHPRLTVARSAGQAAHESTTSRGRKLRELIERLKAEAPERYPVDRPTHA